MYHLIRVDSHTWAFEDRMPDGDIVRFFVLDGKQKCLVIDSGYLLVDVKGMVSDLLKKEGRDLSSDGKTKEILLANTHGDYDHTCGNGSFSSFYITGTDYVNCGLEKQFPDAGYIAAEEGTQIELGERTIRYYLAPGHTYGNAVILDETDKILFPGDMVQTGTMFMFGEHRCPDRMEESLLKLIGMKDLYEKIYSCHGKLILPPDAVDQTLSVWRKVRQGQVKPERATVFGTVEVDLYRCGFCNFYCDIKNS
ncbi:MAG: MBL fold metallo-hydrolase [Parasporobacterium sp.]|nr:MBL fold metallo-hydrolase [Parasporobacterium sp.]